MKPTDTVTTLFNHHLWANLRLLEQCAELTNEQLDATIVDFVLVSSPAWNN